MKKLILALALILSAPAFACEEKSLIHFVSKGVEQPSELIGADDPCDSFGGNLIYTPESHRFLYVNFNIPGTIDLDEVEAAYALVPGSGPAHDFYSRVQLAVVDKGWIKRVYQDDREAILNLAGDTLFVSETVVTEGRFTALLREFYGSR